MYAYGMRQPRHSRIEPGATIPPRVLHSLSGPVAIPDPTHDLVHLQLRRFAGCPVCNLHLTAVARRHGEIEAAGVREVAVFHAPADELRAHAAHLPFAVIPDPDKRLYAELGAETSLRAILDPRAWPAILLGVARTLWLMLRGEARAPSLVPTGGRWGLPADFLIDRNGRVLACRYGAHADDHWSVDEILAHAQAQMRGIGRETLLDRA